MITKDTQKKAVPKKKKITGEPKVPVANHYGTGKRKTSIARVWLFEGTGKIYVNGVQALDFFKQNILVQYLLEPLKKLGVDKKYVIRVTTKGGGKVGQSSAVRLGISRALLAMNEGFRKSLREYNFLTRDPRVKERKKYGRKRARKGYQFRKR